MRGINNHCCRKNNENGCCCGGSNIGNGGGNGCSEEGIMDYGKQPYVADLCELAEKNRNYRTAIWTGCHLQMTLMSIPAGEEIGEEIHKDTDQMLRVESGNGMVRFGDCELSSGYVRRIQAGDAVFVPAGTRHNVVNTGKCPLKLTSVYAPPHHRAGTVQPCRS